MFCLFMVCFLSSCSILEIEYASSNLSVGYWYEYPFVSDVYGKSEVEYFLADENDIRYFDVQKIDNAVYVSYVLGTRNTFPGRTLNYNEVDVRVVKGTYNSSGITWDLLFSRVVEGDNSTTVKTFSLSGVPVVVINSDDKVSLYKFDYGDPTWYTILSSDLFAGYSQIDQINTWIDASGTTHMAAIVGGSRIVVGKFDSIGNWNVHSNHDIGYNISNFQVKMGLNYPYAVWEKATLQELIIATYDYTSTFKNPWTTLNTLKSVTAPILAVESYISPYTGRLVEDVFVGTVNVFRKEFQIYTLNANNQLGYTGAYITGDNTDGVMASNKLGQVFFLRPKLEYSKYYLQSATLNSKLEWSVITAPDKEMNYTESAKIETLFLDDATPFTVYKGMDGLLHLLVGR